MSQESFYLLTFSVSTGDARRHTHFVRGSLDEIKADLARELSDASYLYLLCCRGAHLSLDVYQSGVRSRSIALQPLITISIEGYPAITFEHDCTPAGFDFEAAARGDLDARRFGEEYGASISVSVAWEKVDVPALVAPVAGERDGVTIEPTPPLDAEDSEALLHEFERGCSPEEAARREQQGVRLAGANHRTEATPG